MEDDADQQWKNLNFNEDELVSWAEYKNGTYGSMSEDGGELKLLLVSVCVFVCARACVYMCVL